jgi:HEAT repeat protein
MKASIKTSFVVHLVDLLTGQQERAMEAAKQMIGLPERDVNAEMLVAIAGDPEYKTWSRVAAVYVLGLCSLAAESGVKGCLRGIVADQKEAVRLRSHAVEALGNLRDEGAVKLLVERLFDAAEHKTVRRWCIYALAEVGTAEAQAGLRTFSKSRPVGVLGSELLNVTGYKAA